MRNVVFVAPYFTPNTLRYVEALCELEGVRPAVITSDREERLPPALRERLATVQRVSDCLDGEVLSRGTKAVASRLGAVDRLFGALEQLQLPLAQARDGADVPGMGAAAALRFRDKSAMKAALREAEVPCARYARVTSADDVHEFVRQVGFPIIIKPVDGLGTRATWRLGDESELVEALEGLSPSTGRPWQCEEFLVGTEHSFETVTIDGEHVWSSSTDYIPGPLEAMTTPWIQYCVVLPREVEAMERFQEVNHQALDALGMGTGISHMELFSRKEGTVAVNEVGARPPGVNIMPLMSAAHGVDFKRAWVRLMALDTFDAPRRKRAAGSAFLRGQGQGDRVVAIHGLKEVLTELGDRVYQALLPRVGQKRAAGYEGEGSVIVSASTTEEVMQSLALLIRNVRVILG